MGKLVRCDSCNGRKQIVALGNLIKDCPYCRAIGWIEEPDSLLAAEVKQAMTEPKKKSAKKTKEEVIHG